MNTHKWVLLGLLVLAVNTSAAETLSFDKVEHLLIEGAQIVTLTEASVTEVQISGSDEAMEKLQADLDGTRLQLTHKKSFWRFLSSDKAYRYTLQIPRGSLQRLSLTGSGTLEAATLTAQDLSLHLTGAGRLRVDTLAVSSLNLALTGAAEARIHSLSEKLTHLELQLTGAGRVQLPDIDTEEIRVKLTGSSDLFIQRLQAEHFHAQLTGSSSLKIKDKGEVQQQRLDLSGASHYRADKLLAHEVQVSASGASDVRLHAEESLDATLSGGSSLKYTGSPQTRIDTSGGSHAKAL